MFPTFVLQSPTQGSSTSHLSVHGFLHTLEVCLAVANPYQRRSRIHQRISHAWIKSNWTKPITIDAHIVVNAPEPATTLQHLNNLDACSPYQTPDVTRCVQVHFDAELYPSSEDDVSSRPAKSLTPSPVAAPETPLHSSRADTEIKFQVRQLLFEDHPPTFLRDRVGFQRLHRERKSLLLNTVQLLATENILPLFFPR